MGVLREQMVDSHIVTFLAKRLLFLAITCSNSSNIDCQLPKLLKICQFKVKYEKTGKIMFQVSHYLWNTERLSAITKKLRGLYVIHHVISDSFLCFPCSFPQAYLINSICVTFYLRGHFSHCPIWKVNILGEKQNEWNNIF